MQRLDPRLLEVLEPVSQKQGRGMSRYWDGFHPRTKQEAEREETSLLFEVPEHDLAFWGCVRSQFLLGMVPLLPEGTIRFGKQLVGYADREGSEKVVLRFADGSTAESDVGPFYSKHRIDFQDQLMIWQCF
jgi:salicylate hydroxylase